MAPMKTPALVRKSRTVAVTMIIDPKSPRHQTHEADSAVCAPRDLSQVPGRDQARLSLGQDAKLRAECIGCDGCVVGDDADHEEVAAPRVAQGPDGSRGILVGEGSLSGAKLVSVCDREDGSDEGVGKDWSKMQ
ncbi:unnamed protein product [Clonostachys rosea f. rosea IK726]|uniref:Uncharacterized protein n=1 Tax=Clonostachys rosea f. rosea IK726 TaxID=1349383 RepID=A0ACA9UBV2_BIOOC|nr:unnamed protein product [Clonostachys rosea f. rosea IK726]